MFADRAKKGKKKDRSLGQVVVEMLMILPIFLTIVFTIMELGHMAFWVIVLNHATYEVARLGALTAGSNPGTSRQSTPSNVNGRLSSWMVQVVRGVRIDSHNEPTTFDSQAGRQNYDLVVKATYPVRLVFPLASILLSSRAVCPQGPGNGRCNISTTIRMPVEQPLYK